MIDEEDAALEAAIATISAKLRASSLNRQQKEPFDTPGAMVPVAYAMFEFLADSAQGSGSEFSWHDFLREALMEVIAMQEEKIRQDWGD